MNLPSGNLPSAYKLNITSQAVISILELFRLYGIDETIRDIPFNMFEDTGKTYTVFGTPPQVSGKRITGNETRTSEPVTTLDIRNQISPAVDKSVSVQPENQAAYNNVSSLSDIEEILRETGKNTKAAGSAKHFILTDGETSAPDILIICDHPTSDEEMNGTPGTGKEREFIKSVLAAAGISSQKICTYNICPWRPAGERSLTPDEIDICLAPANSVIGIISPRTVLSFSSIFTPEKAGMKPENSGFSGLFSCPSTQNIRKTPLLKQKVWARIIELKQHLSLTTVA